MIELSRMSYNVKSVLAGLSDNVNYSIIGNSSKQGKNMEAIRYLRYGHYSMGGRKV